MLLQNIFLQLFSEKFVVASVERDTMIINQPKGVDLFMKFFISFRFIKFKTKSFHGKSPPTYFTNLKIFFQRKMRRFIPIVKARGFHGATFGKLSICLSNLTIRLIFMLQLNITGTVQFSQNFIGQNITAQKLVSANASFSLITAVFLFKRFLEYKFLSMWYSWLHISVN